MGVAPSLPQEVPEERTFKHQPLQEKLPREMEPVKGFPRVRNIYDVISDPEGIDEVELKMAADQNVREEMVFHARTHLLQEKIKFCSRREGYNAAELCYPLVQKYLQRMHRMGFVEIPESELAKIYAKDPLAVPKLPTWQDRVSGAPKGLRQ